MTHPDLRAWRRQAAVKTGHAIEILGITRFYLASIERGARRPSLDLAARIERLTGGEIKATDWARETAT